MKKYRYGECIPESIKEYNRLKKQGKSPKLVEGWVEVDNPELLPCEEFLEVYYPDMIENPDNDYPRVFQHTWVVFAGRIIDKTRNQFDIYGGIIRYYEKGRYYFRGKQKVLPIDADIGAEEIWQDTNCIHYPD